MSTAPIRPLAPLPDGGLVYGQSPTMRSLNAMVADVARTDIPVLLIGESGTGKEVYARLIHRLSSFSKSPLARISCAALDGGRALSTQSEGPNDSEEAMRGSWFLDGVDEMDLHCQRALLSLLSDVEARVDGRGTKARLISSTSRNLETEVAAGRFRRELYFRISGVCLHLPPLRERKEDIPALLDYFLSKHASELNRKTPALGSDAIDALSSHTWPGNIRELENTARKMIAVGDARVALDDLRATVLTDTKRNNGAYTPPLKTAARAASRRTERELILQALDRTRWNRKQAARDLQISYKSLLYKIKQISAQGSESEDL